MQTNRHMNRHQLILCSDQHAPNISGFAGDTLVRTPNLDRLASMGTVYENHYCNNPVCTPGRYSMLTGLLPRENKTLFFESVLPSDAYTYMYHFAKHGYMTTCVGKMHFHGMDQMHGWMHRPYGDMEYFDHTLIEGYLGDNDVVGGMNAANGLMDIKYGEYGGYTPYMLKTAGVGDDQFMLFDLSVTRESILHLKNYFQGVIDQKYQNSRPLLFQVSFKGPHCPFIAPKELFDYYRERITMPEITLENEDLNKFPDEMMNRHHADEPAGITQEMILDARASYYALIEFMDSQIGEVLDVLEEMGVMEEFDIMYTSDHGELAGEHGLWQKGCFYEDSVRVPMILVGEQVPSGKRVRTNTSHVDLFPTLCDMANIPIPGGLRGESMIPFSKEETDRPVFSEWYWPDEDGKKTQWEMVKYKDMKFIDYHSGNTQLFDLSNDEKELNNVTGGHRISKRQISAEVDA